MGKENFNLNFETEIIEKNEDVVALDDLLLVMVGGGEAVVAV